MKPSLDKLKEINMEEGVLDMDSASEETGSETELDSDSQPTPHEQPEKRARKRKFSENFYFSSSAGDEAEYEDEETIDKFRKKECLLSEAFTTGLEDLKNFKEQFGHTNVPCNKSYSFLGSWVARQRTKKRKGLLNSTEIECLEELNFVWNLHKENFKQRVEEMKFFQQQYGHVDVSKHKNAALGTWVETQRKKKKRGLLKEDEINALEQIGFSWEPLKKTRRYRY